MNPSTTSAPQLLARGRLPHGCVYLLCPEHDGSVRRRDLEGIARLGFNTVVLWPPVTRWDAAEPGGLAFDSIDHALELCVELGLSVVIELMGQDDNHGPFPEWLPFAHEWPNINHPQIREATLEFLHAVARHFRGHPALIGYCTFNEVHFTEADRWTLDEFVRFLERRYAGDIARLNAAWCTFHRRFDEIPRFGTNFRRRVWSSGLMQRDWFRFQQHNYAERLEEWYRAVREEDPDVCIFADILGCDTLHNRTQYGANDWLTAGKGDVHGLSCYANMLGPDFRQRDAYSWAQFWRQQLSAALGKQTIISELMTHNRSMFPAEGSSMTDELGLWSHQALYNGIQGLIYWKYRPFIRGVQVAGRGLVDTAGAPTPLAEQASRAAAFSARHSERLTTSTPDHAGAAIVHDHDAQDLYMAIQANDPAFYVEAHRGIFRGFWEHGISPRYLTPAALAGGVPSDVTVLAFPCNVCLSEETATALNEFVRRGGILFSEGRFGLLNRDGYVYPHIPGAGLRAAFGVGEAHFSCNARDRALLGAGVVLDLADYLQSLALDGDAQVHVASEQGRPLLVEARVGQGRYLHCAMLLGRAIQRGVPGALELFARAFERLRPALSPAVEVLAKPAMVDVSVLLGARGEPALVGITNYRHEPSRVELRAPLDAARARRVVLDGCDGATLSVSSTQGRGEGWCVELPARSAVAVIFEHQAATGTMAG